jgi:hypothetical protein
LQNPTTRSDETNIVPEFEVFSNPPARQLEELLKRFVRRIRESHPQNR